MVGARLQLGLGRLVAPFVALVAAPFYAILRSSAEIAAARRHARIRINADPEVVHALLDPGSAANRWELRGDRLEAIDRRAAEFRLFDRSSPERAYVVRVTQSSAPSLVAHLVFMEDGFCLGAVDHSESRYDIARDGAGAIVVLTEATTFTNGVSRWGLAFHALIMRFSLRMDLLRLKYEAETGRNADAR